MKEIIFRVYNSAPDGTPNWTRCILNEGLSIDQLESLKNFIDEMIANKKGLMSKREQK